MNNEIENILINSIKHKAPITNSIIEHAKGGGYYSIWITNREILRQEFSEELKERDTNLLYIGIAEISLYDRLYCQELQHKKPATFFRSIGAILGYTPEKGSLIGRSNQNNYKFSIQHTNAIINWINQNIEIAFHYTKIEGDIETDLIKKYSPILNWKHNPKKFQPLKNLKDECRYIARSN